MSYAKSVRTSAVAKHRGAAGQRSASSVNFPLSTAHRPGVSNHPSPSVFHEDHSAAPVQVYVRVRPPEQPAMSMTNVHVNVMAQKVSRQGFTIASYRDSVSPELANAWTNVTDEDGMVREEDHRTWRWTSHSVLYQGDTIGTYEAVLPPESDSKKVYAQVGEPVVHRLLDGYDGCIYAFGQTNSGKTYTVHGTPAEPGIVLRAAHQIFEFIAKTDGVMSMLRVSFLELYNETIRDLLTASPSAESGSAVEDTAALPWTQGGTLGAGQIVNDPDRGVIVAGLTERHVTCLEDVLEAIRDGESRRIIASNYAHEHASRSHTVFQLIFESRNVNQKQVRVSTLHIVDMAGSEASSNMLYEPPISPEPATTTRSRSAMYVPVPVEEPESIAERVSKVHEKRKKEIALRNAEGATIRRSLLALVRCVEVLSQSTAHSYVPYRDSKLTRLLCGTLGGTTYTAVICTMNPAEVKETFKTLRFGNLAQRIVNYPRKVNYLSSQALLIRYDEEVERMRQEVEDMENVRLQEEETMKRNLDSRNEQAKEALAQSLSAREAAMKRLQALQKFVLTSNSQNGEGRRQLQSDLLSVKRAGRTHPRDQHRAYATRAHSFSTLRDTVHHEMADKAWDALSKAMQRETEAMQKLRELRAQRRGIGHPTSQSSGRGANLTLEDLSLEQLREVVKRAQARAKQPDSKTASKVRQDPEEPPIERAKVFTEEDRNRLRMKVAHLREITLQTATEYEAQKAALVVWNREIQKSSGCFGSSTNTPVDVQAHKKSQQDILKMKAYEILRKE